MKTNISAALKRLNSVLPLAHNQANLGLPHKKLHQALLLSMVEQGRFLNSSQISAICSDSAAALNALNDAKLIVLDNDQNIIGTYPFTAQQREHQVHVNGFQVYAMCALDALSVAPMFSCESSITSICRATKKPIKIKQNDANIESAEDYYFGIIWAAASDTISCSDSLCMDMIFLSDAKVASDWLAEDSTNREIFDLEDAVEFGSAFFKPLLKDAD